jgi:hypothetical protein
MVVVVLEGPDACTGVERITTLPGTLQQLVAPAIVKLRG